MYKEKHCSPRKKYGVSCISKELLNKIGEILNEKFECKIKLNCSEKKLHTNISNEIKKISNCKKELCWNNIQCIKNNLNHQENKDFINSFKPVMPKDWYKNPNTWLNTTNIDNVMEQYEKKYDKFKYLGTSSIDFNLKEDGKCIVHDELCKIDVLDLMQDYDSLGLVLNTDKHNERGEHWFSIFIDLKGKNRNIPTIYYFDSAKSEPTEEIVQFVNKLKGQYGRLDFLYNDIKHQYGNTECGIYALHFLTEMLKGRKFKNYLKRKLNDKQIEKYRKKFFIKK